MPRGIEMRVVGEFLNLPGECAHRIMNEQVLGILRAHSLEEHLSVCIQINERHFLPFGNSLHSRRKIAMSILYLSIGIKEPTLRRGAENDISFLRTNHIHEFLQGYGIVIPRSCAWSFLLLVIMPELADYIVAFLYHRKYLLQPVLSHEGGGGKATFGVVGYGYG